MLIRTKIGCGCDDNSACRGGCHWVHEAEVAPLGICSNCAPEIDLLELVEAELDWSLDNGETDTGSELILPGDEEYDARLGGGAVMLGSLPAESAETLCIGNDVEVVIVGVNGNQVRVGIKAPKEMRVDRSEIRERIEAERRRGVA